MIGFDHICSPIDFFQMTITNQKVVSIDYTLKDSDGNMIDTSAGREPVAYLHGTGFLVKGLESELEGKKVGDELDLKITPEEGYGNRIEELVREVPKANFPEGQLQPGMQFQAKTEQGVTVFTVIKIQTDTVIVDGNHPLAGVNLHFQVKVMDIRDASPEEIDHGHVHGPGGHQH